ncbi:hypothetical protein DFH28DRAFT_1119684 [Melampsora americana]|nr:hypothetical protein DFH28DRAFT_1119684 [Melampsora americana]
MNYTDQPLLEFDQLMRNITRSPGNKMRVVCAIAGSLLGGTPLRDSAAANGKLDYWLPNAKTLGKETRDDRERETRRPPPIKATRAPAWLATARGCSLLAPSINKGWSRTYIRNASDDHLPAICMNSMGMPACPRAVAPPDLSEWPDLLWSKNSWNLCRNHDLEGRFPDEVTRRYGTCGNWLSRSRMYAFSAATGHLCRLKDM